MFIFLKALYLKNTMKRSREKKCRENFRQYWYVLPVQVIAILDRLKEESESSDLTKDREDDDPDDDDDEDVDDEDDEGIIYVE